MSSGRSSKVGSGSHFSSSQNPHTHAHPHPHTAHYRPSHPRPPSVHRLSSFKGRSKQRRSRASSPPLAFESQSHIQDDLDYWKAAHCGPSLSLLKDYSPATTSELAIEFVKPYLESLPNFDPLDSSPYPSPPNSTSPLKHIRSLPPDSDIYSDRERELACPVPRYTKRYRMPVDEDEPRPSPSMTSTRKSQQGSRLLSPPPTLPTNTCELPDDMEDGRRLSADTETPIAMSMTPPPVHTNLEDEQLLSPISPEWENATLLNLNKDRDRTRDRRRERARKQCGYSHEEEEEVGSPWTRHVESHPQELNSFAPELDFSNGPQRHSLDRSGKPHSPPREGFRANATGSKLPHVAWGGVMRPRFEELDGQRTPSLTVDEVLEEYLAEHDLLDLSHSTSSFDFGDDGKSRANPVDLMDMDLDPSPSPHSPSSSLPSLDGYADSISDWDASSPATTDLYTPLSPFDHHELEDPIDLFGEGLTSPSRRSWSDLPEVGGMDFDGHGLRQPPGSPRSSLLGLPGSDDSGLTSRTSFAERAKPHAEDYQMMGMGEEDVGEALTMYNSTQSTPPNSLLLMDDASLAFSPSPEEMALDLDYYTPEGGLEGGEDADSIQRLYALRRIALLREREAKRREAQCEEMGVVEGASARVEAKHVRREARERARELGALLRLKTGRAEIGRNGQGSGPRDVKSLVAMMLLSRRERSRPGRRSRPTLDEGMVMTAGRTTPTSPLARGFVSAAGEKDVDHMVL